MSVNMVHPGQFHEQLAMFVGPVEHMASLHSSTDRFEYGTTKGMWEQKETEARTPAFGPDYEHHVHGQGIYESVKKGGVRQPVEVYVDKLGRRMQGEGHHRLAAAAAIQRETGRTQWVPIQHTPISMWHMGNRSMTRPT